MRYTAYKNEWIDKKIERQLELICSEILGRFRDIKSIILAGGFGRGEGSVEIFGNEILPLNDYDLYLVTEENLPKAEIRKASIAAIRRLGRKVFSHTMSSNTLLDTFDVDIRTIPYDKLSKLPPLIRFYELKNASTVLYGENALKKIPDYRVSDIPLAEEARYLLNRMCHLVEFFSTEYLLRSMRSCEKKSVIYACEKAFNECCAALLLLSRKYKPTYTERIAVLARTYEKDFPKLHQMLPDLPEKVRIFTQFKLRPNFGKFGEPLQWWFTARKYIGTVALYYFERFLQTQFDDWMDFSQKIYEKMWKPYLSPFAKIYFRNLFHINLKGSIIPFFAFLGQFWLNVIYTRSLWESGGRFYLNPLFRLRSPEISLYSAVPLLLFSVKREKNVDMNMLKIATERVREVYPVVVKNVSNPLELWNKTRGAFGSAYRIYFYHLPLP